VERYGIRYTEDDIERLIARRRFLAAVHAYSMDIFPLGEAVTRAAGPPPYTPLGIEAAASNQLIQEVAERIVAKKITVPDDIRQEYPDIYRSYEPGQDYFGARTLRFSELLDPTVKKKEFQLYRDEFDETDIQAILADRRALAAFDAYRTMLPLGRLKTLLYGDLNAHPRDLSFDAFVRLSLVVVERMKRGEIEVPAELRREFPEMHAPENQDMGITVTPCPLH
jgi:hypothetical protein